MRKTVSLEIGFSPAYDKWYIRKMQCEFDSAGLVELVELLKKEGKAF